MARSLRVLIVDDQPRARQSLKAVVTSWLHSDQVAEAQDGVQAVHRAEEQHPDVILMDARMPEMSGIEATRLIKAKRPETHIIILSIYPAYREQALAAGADLFLGKTEPPERLFKALTEIAQTVGTP